MEIWEPKPPGTLWATLDLSRDTFTCIYHLHFYISPTFLYITNIFIYHLLFIYRTHFLYSNLIFIYHLHFYISPTFLYITYFFIYHLHFLYITHFLCHLHFYISPTFLYITLIFYISPTSLYTTLIFIYHLQMYCKKAIFNISFILVSCNSHNDQCRRSKPSGYYMYQQV